MILSNQDIENITWLIEEKIVDLSEDFYKALAYGSDFKDCLRDKILILKYLNETIGCYNSNLSNEENCFSQIEIETLLYYISTTFNIYFPQYTGQDTENSEVFDDSFDYTFN